MLPLPILTWCYVCILCVSRKFHLAKFWRITMFQIIRRFQLLILFKLDWKKLTNLPLSIAKWGSANRPPIDPANERWAIHSVELVWKCCLTSSSRLGCSFWKSAPFVLYSVNSSGANGLCFTAVPSTSTLVLFKIRHPSSNFNSKNEAHFHF